MSKNIFVNLPVRNIENSKFFFGELGFSFKPEFTGDSSICLIIGENIYAMLLDETSFKSFIPGKEISNSKETTEVLIAIDTESREKTDEMIEKIISLGGKEFRQVQDYGWMYIRAFEDLDGHIWEIGYMDESKLPEEMKNKAS